MSPKLIAIIGLVAVAMGWPMLQSENTDTLKVVLGIIGIACGLAYQSWHAKNEDSDED